LAATTYCFVWDLYMDWGLFRNLESKSPNFLLRNKIMFPRWFYFYAIVVNFALRYLWLVQIIFQDPEHSSFWSLDQKL